MEIGAWLDRYRGYIESYRTSLRSEETAAGVLEEFRACVEGKRILLYGAGCVGRDFSLLFGELEIPVAFALDKNYQKGLFLGDMEVKSPETLKGLERPEDYILIGAIDRAHLQSIEEDIRTIAGDSWTVWPGHDIHMLLQSAWCLLKACDEEKSIRLKDCYECTCLDNTCEALNRYLRRINRFQKDGASGTKAVRMIGYLLGNICTLNCKNCCESVPYMPREIRGFVDKETVLGDIEKLSGACEFLTLLEFIGGEPFLHPDLPEILERVLNIGNIGMIHVFTNGTVTPGPKLCRVLGEERISVYLSNYQVSYPERLLGNVRRTVEKLEECKASYFFGKKQNWLDFSGYELQCTQEEELRGKFPDCFLHNCNRLYNGILYCCPHQYAGVRLGRLDGEKDVVRIHDFSREELARKLEAFKALPYIDACRYCSMPFHAKTVLSGEQLPEGGADVG